VNHEGNSREDISREIFESWQGYACICITFNILIT
jgi:hypothetical protein